MTPRSRRLTLALAVLAATGCGETRHTSGEPALPAVREYLAKTHGWPGKPKPSAVGRRLVERLPNGMTVVLQEKHAVPVATVQLWVKTGAMDEAEFLGAGVSHYLEHMLFKGTQKRRVREFDQAVQAAGGWLNAVGRSRHSEDMVSTSAGFVPCLLTNVCETRTMGEFA